MKCRYCGCTYERGCPAGCEWVGNTDICTVCADFRDELVEYTHACNRVTKASLARIFDDTLDEHMRELRAKGASS
jgi:hypothetical protein